LALETLAVADLGYGGPEFDLAYTLHQK